MRKKRLEHSGRLARVTVVRSSNLRDRDDLCAFLGRFPVAPYVLDAVRPFVETDLNLNAHGFLFVHRRAYGHAAKGCAPLLGCYTPNGARNRFLRRLRDLENEDAFTAPNGFMPRKLRATFVSAVRDLDADGDTLRAYIGQTPTTVLTARYDVPGIERLGKIAALAQGMVGADG